MRVDLGYEKMRMGNLQIGSRLCWLVRRIYRLVESFRLLILWRDGRHTISWLGTGHAQVLQIRIRPLV